MDHSYQQVVRTPIDDLAFTSSGEESPIPSWVSSKNHKQSDTKGDNKIKESVHHSGSGSTKNKKVSIFTIQALFDLYTSLESKTLEDVDYLGETIEKA